MDQTAGRRCWEESLAGAPAALGLLRDHQRPAEQGYRAGTSPFALSDELSAALRELGRQEKVALPTALAAALGTLLYRYTGQDDFLMGLVTPGPRQPAPAEDGFPGGVVLRADLSGNPTVRDLLGRMQSASEAAGRREDVPFEAIVTAGQPERSRRETPPVQVLLAVGPSPAGRTARFDLCLEVDDRDGPLTGRFVYNSKLFEPGTIGQLTGHWLVLLRTMVAAPSRPVTELELIPPDEMERMRRWGVGAPAPVGPGLLPLIDAQAAAKPEATAVVCEREQLSYGELEKRANQLARHLRQLGVAAEVPVGVLAERSVDHIVALVAILKAGGAYVPLDPESPQERIEYVVQDTRMPVLLTHERLAARVRGTQAVAVSLDGDRELIGRQSEEKLAGDEPADDHLAYVIYTSGSTGQPKGVMVERGVLAAHVRAMIAEYELSPQDRVLQFSQYSADASLEQILPALAVGARLIMRGTEIWSPRQLLEELTSHRVTVMNLSPAHWQHAVWEWARSPHELAGTCLRLVILGGERLGAAAVRQWRELGLAGVRLLNAYGPTEATITATLADAGQEQDRITIGRPLPGRIVHILDSGGQPVPVGVVGELHIGGPLLARGYLNRPEVTRERFVADRFGPPGGGRLYRTGDLARYLSDGRIDYVGRADHQVQIRGYRVELGEIEAVLAQHSAVAEAVVMAQGDSGDTELTAYVVARDAQPLAEEDLHGYLEQKLPRHMRPGSIALLGEMPRLPSGKPDRRRLPQVERRTRPDDAAYLPPQGMIEQQLVEIWEELLEARPIGVRDNFFHLGGHSLLAAQLVDRIEQACGKRLALSTLFANPTVGEMADALQAGEGKPAGSTPVLPLHAEGTRRPFFFVHGDWTGGAFYCFALARACGPDQPFYVLEPCTFDAWQEPPTIEAIAAAHIEGMRTVQPHGPYRLGGFCNGGLLAYEMARQLEQAGEAVEFLGLINPSEAVQFSPLRAACEGLGRFGVARRKRADLFLRVRHVERHIYRRLRPRGARVQDFGKLLGIEPRLAAMFPPRGALYHDYVGVFTWAATGYQTGIYDGKITFYWARDEPGIEQTWQPIAGRKRPVDVEQHVVPGTHLSCVTDHVDDIAPILSECLSRVEEAAGAEVVGHRGVQVVRP